MVDVKTHVRDEGLCADTIVEMSDVNRRYVNRGIR